MGTFIALSYWFRAPGPQVPTEGLLSEDTVVALRVGDLGREDSLAEMLVGAATRLNPPVPMPEGSGGGAVIRWLASRRRQPTAKDVVKLKRILPRDATAVLELSPGAESPKLLAAVNLRSYPKVFRGLLWLVSKGEGPASRRVREGNSDYHLLGNGAGVAFEGGTIVISRDGAAMPGILSRLRSSRGQPPPAASLFDPGSLPPGGWDLYVGLDNRDGAFEHLIGKLPVGCAEAASGSPRGGSSLREASAVAVVRAGVRAADPDELQGTVRIGCRDESETSIVLARLQYGSDCLVERAREAGFETELTHRVEGADVVASFRLRRVQAGIAQIFERFIATAQARNALKDSSPDEGREDQADP